VVFYRYSLQTDQIKVYGQLDSRLLIRGDIDLEFFQEHMDQGVLGRNRPFFLILIVESGPKFLLLLRWDANKVEVEILKLLKLVKT